MARRRRKLLKVTLNVGHKCGTCGQRYLNPFAHVCKIKFGEKGQKRVVKKNKGK